MALKTITFTVGADGALSPATIQDAGVQGDHRKTEAVFKFSDGLYTYLQGKSADGKLVYRFDGYDGEGAVYHSDTAVLCEREVVYPLEYFLTRHGGLVKVELIITLINGEESAEVLHTPAAQLKFIFAPYSTGDKAQEYSDLSALAEIVKQCAARAETAERAAEEARAQTAMLAAAFENGTTYIFDGGNASGEIDAAFIIDGEMSEYSYNAVKNKVIKAYVDGKFPVGSIWVGGKDADGVPIDPADIFGGRWVKKKVNKTVVGKEQVSVSQINTVIETEVDILEHNILSSEVYSITAAPVTGSPDQISLSVGNIEVITESTESPDDTEVHISRFDILTQRTTLIDFPVLWTVTGKSYSDENGLFRWQRVE